MVGLALLVLGIYLLASSNSLEFVTGNSIASGSVLILIAGFVTMLISLIGILGAAGRWTVLLVIVSASLLLLLLMVLLPLPPSSLPPPPPSLSAAVYGVHPDHHHSRGCGRDPGLCVPE